MNGHRCLCAAFVCLAWMVSWAPASEPIPDSQFEHLRVLIKPRPDEQKWLQVPWQSSLWEARKKAAAEGKPILLWEMDGNPLGCT
ncbi:MAG TPA: hypothetical protein VFA18_01885 [Gemmataceae bacterium]|nr:hypothetical protein [Gemmataceae bacterium]